MWYKRMAALLCTGCLLLGFANAPAAYAGQVDLVSTEADYSTVEPSKHILHINGQRTAPQAYLIDHYNYYKLRDVAMLLSGTKAQFEVEWEEQTGNVVLTQGAPYTTVGGEMAYSTTEGLRIHASTAQVILGGAPASIKGYNINNNNYYKIADLAEVLQFSVAFDVDTYSVLIETEEREEVEDEEDGDEAVQGTQDPPATDLTEPTPSGTETEGTENEPAPPASDMPNTVPPAVDTEGTGTGQTNPGTTNTDTNNADTTTPDTQGTNSNTPNTSSPVTPGIYRVSVKSNSYLTIRNSPSTSGAPLGKLSNGDQIIVDRIENGWAHLKDPKGTADRYCSLDYLDFVQVYGTATGTTPSTDAPSSTPQPDPEITPPEDPSNASGDNQTVSNGSTRVSQYDGVKTVVIDPGHGGKDVGAVSQDGKFNERSVNLGVALKLRDLLREAGYTVYMVRETIETGETLSERGTFLDKHLADTDLFLSIHHNASSAGRARGAEVLAQVADEYGGPSRIFAELLLEEYRAIGVPIRQIVYRANSSGTGDYYYINRMAAQRQVVAVISEFCFIDNNEDLALIDSEADLALQAQAQFRAIERYFTQVAY